MTYITEKATIYISKDSTLKKRGDVLLIYQDGKKQSSIPAFKIKDIVIFGQVEISASIIDFVKPTTYPYILIIILANILDP